MDLLFKRYASPFLFIDNCLELKNLDEVVEEIFKIDDEEKQWELYVNTALLNDKSFEEWKNVGKKVSNQEETEEFTDDELETAINNSQNILKGFDPRK